MPWLPRYESMNGIIRGNTPAGSLSLVPDFLSGQNYFEFPYFLIYCIDNGLKPLDALKGLFKELPSVISLIQTIEESDDYSPEKYNCLNIWRYFPGRMQMGEKLPSARCAIKDKSWGLGI